MNPLLYLTYSLMLASALSALWLKDLIHAVISLSVFSITLCLTFALYYAPDVAVAEAVVGAGLTTGFLILAVSQTRKARQ